jgi:hypothetical protein
MTSAQRRQGSQLMRQMRRKWCHERIVVDIRRRGSATTSATTSATRWKRGQGSQLLCQMSGKVIIHRCRRQQWLWWWRLGHMHHADMVWCAMASRTVRGLLFSFSLLSSSPNTLRSIGRSWSPNKKIKIKIKTLHQTPFSTNEMQQYTYMVQRKESRKKGTEELSHCSKECEVFERKQ